MAKAEDNNLIRVEAGSEGFPLDLETLLKGVHLPSKPRDQINACELRAFILKNARAVGREGLKNRFRAAGCDY